MPVTHVGFKLKPSGFFAGQPGARHAAVAPGALPPHRITGSLPLRATVRRVSRAALLLLAFLCLAAPAQAQSVNLLTNASFEQSSGRGWAAYGGGPVDVSTGSSGGAREGARYGVVKTSAAGNAVYQDVTTNVLARRSYSLSLWVKSASGRPFKGTLALYGILNTESEGTGDELHRGCGLDARHRLAEHDARPRRAAHAGVPGHRRRAAADRRRAAVRHRDRQQLVGAWELGRLGGGGRRRCGAGPRRPRRQPRRCGDHAGGWPLLLPGHVRRPDDGTELHVLGLGALAGRAAGQGTGRELGHRLGRSGGRHDRVHRRQRMDARHRDGQPFARRLHDPARAGLRRHARRPAAGRRRRSRPTTAWRVPSFEAANFANWSRFPRGTLSAPETTVGAAHEGTSATGRCSTDEAGRSFAQDVAVATGRRREPYVLGLAALAHRRARARCCSPALGGERGDRSDAVLRRPGLDAGVRAAGRGFGAQRPARRGRARHAGRRARRRRRVPVVR